MPSLTRYCRHLFDEGGMQDEAVHLIDSVTTNKADFFREPEHFRVLRDMTLPQPVADAAPPAPQRSSSGVPHPRPARERTRLPWGLPSSPSSAAG